MATWLEAAEEAYASAPVDVVFFETLEFHHSTFASPVRVVSDPGEFISEGAEGEPDIFGVYLTLEGDAPEDASTEVLFQSVGFRLKLPEQSDTKISGIELELDNVQKVMAPLLDQIISVRDPLTLIYREYFESDTSVPNYVLKNLTVTKIASDSLKVSITTEFADLVNRKFPNKEYRPDQYRSLLV